MNAVSADAAWAPEHTCGACWRYAVQLRLSDASIAGKERKTQLPSACWQPSWALAIQAFLASWCRHAASRPACVTLRYMVLCWTPSLSHQVQSLVC